MERRTREDVERPRENTPRRVLESSCFRFHFQRQRGLRRSITVAVLISSRGAAVGLWRIAFAYLAICAKMILTEASTKMSNYSKVVVSFALCVFSDRKSVV